MNTGSAPHQGEIQTNAGVLARKISKVAKKAALPMAISSRLLMPRIFS
jgi:hypothetical protein